MNEGTFPENSAMHDVANGAKWKNVQKCRWVIFPIFYLWDPSPLKMKKDPIKWQRVLFRENGALYGVANGPKWKNAEKCRWVIFPIFS